MAQLQVLYRFVSHTFSVISKAILVTTGMTYVEAALSHVGDPAAVVYC